MLYAHFTDARGNDVKRFFWAWDEYHAATFSPDCEVYKIIDFDRQADGKRKKSVNGYWYKTRKAAARENAMEIMDAMTGGESYAMLAEIGEYLYTIGRRNGLLREFRENGII